jgi:large subunit ribosomal protein L2
MQLWRGKSVKNLTLNLTFNSGRNSRGKIVLRHRGGAHGSRYRVIDFDRHDFNNQFAVVKRVEYDPNRNVPISLICYQNGVLSYILTVNGVRAGNVVANGTDFESKNGNSLPLSYIPPGTLICSFRFFPNFRSGLARAAGAFGQVLKRFGKNYVMIKIPSGQKRFFHVGIWATVGVPAVLKELRPEYVFKAGRSRWFGIRPRVRGVAMNPVDHPHGGNTAGGRPSVSPWSRLTKGYVTKPKRFRSKLIYK